MALFVYSKRLAAVQNVTDSGSFKPPPGFVWVLRDMEFVCTSAVAGNISIYIAVPVINIDIANWPMKTWWQWQGRIVVTPDAGDGLRMIAAHPTSWVVSGYELSLP